MIEQPTQTSLLKGFKEQIAALDMSIKLAEQGIYHKQLLIENYKGQQEELKLKIAKMENI